MPGVSRDWNAAPKHGGPASAEAVKELQDWRAAERKAALLKAGLPLPPELRGALPEGARLSLLDKPAPADATHVKPRVRRCHLRTKGLTCGQFLAQLDAECAIDWDV